MGKYKLIAFDLDGTLLNSKGRILESSKEAIKKAEKHGVKVVLVTGRHHVAVRPYHWELSLETPAICCNGAYIMDFRQPKPIYSNPLSKHQSRRIIKIARERDLHILMYVEDAMTYEVLNPHMQKLSSWAQAQPAIVRPNIKQIDDAMKVMEASDSIHKFVLSHPDQKHFVKACQDIQKMKDVSCERSWIDRMDIANAGNTKGSTLLRLVNQWGINREEIIAVGDNDNDISMIRMAGLGVAMRNGSEELMPVADLTIGGNDENSITEMIEKYVIGSAQETAV